jgi:hypothetical protein
MLTTSCRCLGKIEINGNKRRDDTYAFRILQHSRLCVYNIKSVTIIFVPDHAGVKGNERADMLASEASVQADAVIDRSDILNALSEIGRSSDYVQHSVSETTDRLQDLHIQRGISKREHHAGVPRRLINQHMMGTISVYTLRTFIQERNGMVWTCVNC